ncbi:MAG: phosphoribosylamine--glycine ligase [Saprospiraceae bacterium]|nr:phosphoribosylamine--glycine ligase [Saprospiraceae bacterium]
MNILVLGSGGREHAMAAKIAESPSCTKLVIAPGNPGMANLGRTVNVALSDFDGISKLIFEEAIDCVVVGPEQPLVEGIADFLEDAHPEVLVIGPKKYGAQLEGSKAFAKEFMKQYNIPTAAYFECTKDNLDEGLKHLEQTSSPYVLKADGLAAGKGVLIISDLQEAKEELTSMINGKFGEASSTVVIEQFLSGIEFSVFVLTDGFEYVLLPEAKDYKRIGEGDTGLNTGGMGAVSPVPFFKGDVKIKTLHSIIEPTIQGLASAGIPYVGFIFFGLILVDNEPMVIEYNCRMGDPETEAVFPRITSDVVALFEAIRDGKLGSAELEVSKQEAGTIILVSGGYPGDYAKGLPIHMEAEMSGSKVFHSGTSMKEGQLVTNGGRVLAITSLDTNFQDALKTSKNNAQKIRFEGKYFRSDIGFDLI